VIIPRIKSDLFDLIEGVVKGDLAERSIEIDERFVTTVMLVSGGYPGDYEKGKQILGLDLTNGSVVFHAGTRNMEDKVVTSGGRVIAVSAYGNTLNEALSNSYRNAALLSFDGISYRTDIGFDL
jgi:phosphoribosylamine--glycine ligase